MSHVALDMRQPQKCFSIDYPGYNTIFSVVYEILDPKTGAQHAKPPLDIDQVVLSAKLNKKPLHDHVPKELKGKWNLTHKDPGVLQLCVSVEQQVGKKYIKPVLVALRVSEKGNSEGLEAPDVDIKIQKAAQDHLSDMEKVLGKMTKDVNLLLKTADIIKDEEHKFHKKSEEMNAASKWWPVLHLCVLLGTGFTQVNHIVKFFKSRHII